MIKFGFVKVFRLKRYKLGQDYGFELFLLYLFNFYV